MNVKYQGEFSKIMRVIVISTNSSYHNNTKHARTRSLSKLHCQINSPKSMHATQLVGVNLSLNQLLVMNACWSIDRSTTRSQKSKVEHLLHSNKSLSFWIWYLTPFILPTSKTKLKEWDSALGRVFYLPNVPFLPMKSHLLDTLFSKSHFLNQSIYERFASCQPWKYK